jgi:hypothetical protein
MALRPIDSLSGYNIYYKDKPMSFENFLRQELKLSDEKIEIVNNAILSLNLDYLLYGETKPIDDYVKEFELK